MSHLLFEKTVGAKAENAEIEAEPAKNRDDS